MTVMDDYLNNGGLWGYTLKLAYSVMNNPENMYHSSLQRLIHGEHCTQIEEARSILQNKDHPMHYFISLSLLEEVILAVANDAVSLSYDQLIKKYGDSYLVDVGITRAQINHQKEIDKQNGRLGQDKRVAEVVKNEAIRLYKANKKLFALPATDVATSLHKNLIDFIKTKEFEKKDYTSRTIEGWIRAERNK